MRFSRTELEGFRDAKVPDLIGPDVKLLFVGINPGLWTAATATHFAHPGNRFYPALQAAEIIDFEVDRSAGFSEHDRLRLIERGIGISNLVNRATARADELSDVELIEGASRLVSLVDSIRPKVVAIVGVTAYRVAFGVPGAVMGRQPEGLGEVALWVMPNPSGLNAHQSVASLAAWYRAAAVDAGVVA